MASLVMVGQCMCSVLCTSIHSDVHHSPDINECADPSVSMCGSNAMCINTNGSFVCECPPGFEGDTCSGEQSTEVNTCVLLC